MSLIDKDGRMRTRARIAMFSEGRKTANKSVSKVMLRRLTWLVCGLAVVGFSLQFLFTGEPSPVDAEFDGQLYEILNSHDVKAEEYRRSRFWTGRGQTHFRAVNMNNEEFEAMLSEVLAATGDGSLSTKEMSRSIRYEVVSGKDLSWEWSIRIEQSLSPLSLSDETSVKVTVQSDSGPMRVTTIYDNHFPPDYTVE